MEVAPGLPGLSCAQLSRQVYLTSAVAELSSAATRKRLALLLSSHRCPLPECQLACVPASYAILLDFKPTQLLRACTQLLQLHSWQQTIM